MVLIVSHDTECHAGRVRNSLAARQLSQDHAPKRSEWRPTLPVTIPRGHERGSAIQSMLRHRVIRVYKLPTGPVGRKVETCANAEEFEDICDRLLLYCATENLVVLPEKYGETIYRS